MKTRTVVMVVLVLTAVLGAVAQAPSPDMRWVTPDGTGFISITAQNWGLAITMAQGTHSAQMIMSQPSGQFPGVAYMTLNEGFATSRLSVGQGVGKLEVSNSQGQFSVLTPDGLWVGGVRKF